MDSVGAIAEGEWSSLSGMYTTCEEVFMAQLLGNYPLPDELAGSSNLGIPSAFWPGHHHSTINITGASYSSSDIADASSNSISQGCSYSAGSSILFSFSGQESFNLQSDSQVSHPVFLANDSSMTMDFCMEDATNTSSYLVEDDDCLNQKMGNVNVEQAGKTHQELAHPNENLEPSKESEMPQAEPMAEKKRNLISENSKKRSRSSRDVQKNRRNARLKKNRSGVFVSTTNNDEDGNAGLSGQSLASCSSEDDSNPCEEFNGVISSLKGDAAMNLNGKTRASKEAATDPQSLYARKRRERINERLRILQNLVPNGTKVDISTMLEEAVRYVEFLQLQIRLLSSDDLWMYAPIAYNGMDIGLDVKVATPKRS